MEVKLSEMQKRQLEKIYNKIFQDGDFTEDGLDLLNEAHIMPDDLIPRQYEYF